MKSEKIKRRNAKTPGLEFPPAAEKVETDEKSRAMDATGTKEKFSFLRPLRATKPTLHPARPVRKVSRPFTE